MAKMQQEEFVHCQKPKLKALFKKNKRHLSAKLYVTLKAYVGPEFS